MSQLFGRIPQVPTGFDLESFFANTFWFQRWEVFEGVFTPGVNSIPNLCRDLRLPVDLSGKRVLDIGAWSGCLSFECERRGAREVIALEPADPALMGFHKLHQAVGSKRTHLVRGSVYDLNPAKLGHFDIVLFCGVLYHLRYPILAMDNIRRVCRGDVFVETLVSDAQVLVPDGKEFRSIALESVEPGLLDVPLWQFYRRDEMSKDPSNWFGPTATAVQEGFGSAGFDMTLLKNCGRATFHGRVKPGLPEFLDMGCIEADYYDCVIRHLFGEEKDTWIASEPPPPLRLTQPILGESGIASEPPPPLRLTQPILGEPGIVVAPSRNPIVRLWGVAKNLGKRVLRKAAKETRRLRRAG